MRLDTMSDIAREYDVDLPSYEVEAIRPYVQMTDDEPHTYRNFLAKFRVLRHFYQTQQVVERVTYEAVVDAAEDNVRYLELRFTPSALGNIGKFSLEDVTQWVIRSVREAEANHDIRVGLIMNMNRHEDISIGRQMKPEKSVALKRNASYDIHKDSDPSPSDNRTRQWQTIPTT